MLRKDVTERRGERERESPTGGDRTVETGSSERAHVMKSGVRKRKRRTPHGNGDDDRKTAQQVVTAMRSLRDTRVSETQLYLKMLSSSQTRKRCVRVQLIDCHGTFGLCRRSYLWAARIWLMPTVRLDNLKGRTNC
ncbi:hypothetical protein GQ600_25948 [Phytophthora cactorum]|nr:hypothetical protein GQ600_25948 [Phytophthora cactorum]